MTVVTLRALKLPLDSDTMFQLKTPLSPVPLVTRDPPTPVAGHVETSGAIYNIFTPSYEGISLCFSPLSSLASSLTVAMALWINDITSVCMLARVFVCGDESWNLQTEWTQLANIRWRAEAQTAGIQLERTHNHTHTPSSYGPSPTHSPTHTRTTNQSVTHPVTHSQTNGQEKLIGLMMITADAFQNACTVMLAICNFK